MNYYNATLNEKKHFTICVVFYYYHHFKGKKDILDLRVIVGVNFYTITETLTIEIVFFLIFQLNVSCGTKLHHSMRKLIEKEKKTDLLHFELCTTNFHYLLVKAGEPEIISIFECNTVTDLLL